MGWGKNLRNLTSCSARGIRDLLRQQLIVEQATRMLNAEHHMVTCGTDSGGAHCKFPFQYGGEMFITCTARDHTELWCGYDLECSSCRLWEHLLGLLSARLRYDAIIFFSCSL